MIIKKIYLENYRSHKNTTLELTSGINLILGANGSGKSSILEAIGKVIFDVNDRSGKQIGKNFIRYGETSATVEIEFIANDDRRYLIKNKYYLKKPSTLILKDIETGEEYKEEIREKINELCGIKKDYTKIYDNIIIAKQNEFINIFKEGAKKREEVFNKVFNTEIYSEMYNGTLKKIEDKYSKEKENFEFEKNILSSNLQDENELLKNIDEENLRRIELQKEIGNLNKAKKNLANEIDFFYSKQSELEKKVNLLKNKSTNIDERRKSLKEKIKNAKKAKGAKKKIVENEADFFTYKSLMAELEFSKKEYENFKRIEEINIKLINRNEKLTWEINKNTENITKLNLELSENSSLKKDLELEISILENQERSLKLAISNFRKNLNEIEKIEQCINNFEKEKFSLDERIKLSENFLKEKKEEISECSRLDIEAKILEISDIKEKINELKNKIIITTEKIKALNEAREKLANKFCPLLLENCENVKNKNVNDYFIDKISDETIKKKQLESSLLALEEKVKSEKKLKESLNNIVFLEKEIENTEKNIQNSLLSSKKIGLELEKKCIDIEKVLLSLKLESKNDLKEKLEENLMLLSKLNLEEKKKNILFLDKKIMENRVNIDDLSLNNKKYKNEIQGNQQKIDRTNSEKLSQIEEKIKNIEEKQKKLLKSYNIYLENINISNTMEDILNQIKITIKEIYTLRAEKIILIEDKNILQSEIEKISIVDLTESSKKIDLDLANFNSILGSRIEKIKNLNIELENLKNQKQKIEKILKDLKKVESKLYKTKLIRNNIKGMGLKISKYMLESISNAASINFNKITARAERILWTNETYIENGKEKENKYAVYLIGENIKTAFEHLSGGEQVSVAISLRETMTEYFSNSKFIILDEPTNNLDKERKKLLAEYMGELLNNLDQSIIVTHDNTFREMAERIIEL